MHPGQQEHVAGDDGLDERVADVASPALRLTDQRGRSGIAAVEDVLRERPTERGLHLGKAPVREPQDFEASGQALADAPLHKERRRAEQHDPQRPARAGVRVPQRLDRLRPPDDFLHLIEDKERPGRAPIIGEQAGRFPLLLDPDGVAQRRLVGAGVVRRERGQFRRLSDQRGLSDLSRSGDDLEKAAGFLESRDEVFDLRPLKGCLFTHLTEYFYSN